MKGVKAGDRLKVKESRIVYHSPKHKVQHFRQAWTVGCLLLAAASCSHAKVDHCYCS